MRKRPAAGPSHQGIFGVHIYKSDQIGICATSTEVEKVPNDNTALYSFTIN